MSSPNRTTPMHTHCPDGVSPDSWLATTFTLAYLLAAGTTRRRVHQVPPVAHTRRPAIPAQHLSPGRQRRVTYQADPEDPIGCKRILISNDYYGALTRDNVDVVTSPITEVTPSGITTSDGLGHDVDAIIYGTGFSATEVLGPMH